MSRRLRASAMMLGGLVLGMGLAGVLIVQMGPGTIARAIVSVGWGIVALVAFRLVPVLSDSLAWRAVLGRDWQGGPCRLALIRWIRDSINLLLPVAQVGGDMVGARLLAFAGVPAGVAGASVLVDKTLEAAAQVPFAVIGAALLLARGAPPEVTVAAAVGTVLAVVAVALLLGAQKAGLGRWIEALFGRLVALFGGPRDSLAGLDAAARGYYAKPRRCVAAVLLHFLSWVSGTFEVWLILRFMGHPVGLVDAFVIESIGKIASSAAFAVPGAIGVQEAGYMLVGTMTGLPAEIGLAVSLVKRVRHLIAGLPALLVWQALEGRHFSLSATKREDVCEER